MLPALLAAVLVWVPPENFAQWSKVDGLLRENSELKLTIALTPEMTTPLAKAALGPWAANGRVEIAVRIHGDPILPLVASHPAAPRPDDALERAAEARQSVERRMGVPAAGFVPGAGALDPSLVGPLGAAGSPWVLAGPYETAGSPWAAEGATVFVPARSAPVGAMLAADELTGPGVLVVDESAAPEEGLIEALKALRGTRPKEGWATVSDLVRAAGAERGSAENVGSWPAWNGAPSAQPSDASVLAAWNAYGEAAKALSRYQNSGAADMKVLENATHLLRKAQDARFYRVPPPGAPSGLPRELRADLLAAYRRIKTTAPDSLYAARSSTAPLTAAELPTGVRAASGPGWVGFDNPLGTVARSPAAAPNADPWRLRGLRIEWNDERVLFRIFPARVDAAPAAPRPVYDVYVDLNHLVGAGSIRLLDGRGAFAQARDAWEYSLSVCGADARLWRAGAGDEPDELAKVSAELDPVKSEIRVSVPRELLRGNPERWGYILLALAEDPARAGHAPAAALVGPDGAQTLGLLAPLDVQKTVLEHPGTPQRVAAARLEAGPRP